jgi:hypothetical protein
MRADTIFLDGEEFFFVFRAKSECCSPMRW